MGGGTDVCRDVTIFTPGLHENVSTRDNFTGTICKVSIISSRQSGTECLYDKNCPVLAGIPVERTRIPLCRDGTKNIPAKLFPYKRYGTNKRYITHAWRDPASPLGAVYMGGGTGRLQGREVEPDLAMHVYICYWSRSVYMERIFPGRFSSRF